MLAVGTLVGLALVYTVYDLGAAVRELRRSRARLVTASDAERRRIERDLHNGAQQELISLRIKLGLALELAAGDRALAACLAELVDGLERALDELRELAHGIYPAALVDAGLQEALVAAAARSEQAVSVEADLGRYPIELESAVYYCCLEALQNVAKHAGPRARPTIAAAEWDDRLVFVVADSGRGFDVGSAPRGDGIANMEDRLGAVGGQLEIVSAPGSGTTVTGTVPLGDFRSAQVARRKSGENAAFGETSADDA